MKSPLNSALNGPFKTATHPAGADADRLWFMRGSAQPAAPAAPLPSITRERQRLALQARIDSHFNVFRKPAAGAA